MVEKMTVKESADMRAYLYNMVLTELESHGYSNQPIKGGSLVALEEGQYAKVSISICAPDKVDKYIQEYAEQQEKNAIRAKERAEKQAEKARKAAERASKTE